jgi:phenylalanyl-tRNA synthetase alpha subunit
MNHEIEAIKNQALAAIDQATSLDELKEVKIAHVGDRSPIARANQSLGQAPSEQRAELGKLISTRRARFSGITRGNSRCHSTNSKETNWCAASTNNFKQ